MGVKVVEIFDGETGRERQARGSRKLVSIQFSSEPWS
jgi:hypothetical protein